jgi:hypothetical protein
MLSSRARTWARTSSRAFCSRSRSASRWSRLISRVLSASSSHRRVMSSNSSCSCSSPSSFSASCSRWLTWHARAASSSSCLVMALARASADAYSSYASARARRVETMLSGPRRCPLSIIVHLSMVAHNWRRLRSSARSSPSRRRTHCACDSA